MFGFIRYRSRARSGDGQSHTADVQRPSFNVNKTIFAPTIVYDIAMLEM